MPRGIPKGPHISGMIDAESAVADRNDGGLDFHACNLPPRYS
ncbi:MAG: hypothetical protein ABI318_00860 [Chthoniobacteraceae bacterium]